MNNFLKINTWEFHLKFDLFHSYFIACRRWLCVEKIENKREEFVPFHWLSPLLIIYLTTNKKVRGPSTWRENDKSLVITLEFRLDRKIWCIISLYSFVLPEKSAFRKVFIEFIAQSSLTKKSHLKFYSRAKQHYPTVLS